ncbi:MAG: V-type ATP synthase subunit I [Firmicutes bacterium]|nr:V-type ATP synthase subunit I [Bacillota bacterium]
MAVASMRKVFLVAHRDERDAVAAALQRLGVLQVEDILDLEDVQAAGFINRDEPGPKASQIDAQLAELRFCLDFIQRLAPEKTTFIQQFTGTKVFLEEEQFNNYLKNKDQVTATQRALRAADEKLNQIRNQKTANNNLLATLEPYLALDVPLEQLSDGAYLALEVGVFPLDDLTTVRQELEEASPGLYLKQLEQRREEIFVFIIHAQMDREQVGEILRRHSFSRAVLPSLPGTPAEITARTKEELRLLDTQENEVRAEAEKYVENRLILKSAYDALALQRSQLELALNLGRTEETFALTGWVPAKELPQLEQALAKVSPGAYLTVEEPGADDNPPIVLENTRAVWPFEVITELFGLPEPGGIDPTPYLAPFYFIFFGIMYGDAAYGLILAGLCCYLMKKIRMAGMAKKLFTLLTLCGFAAVLFGIITGSYFGSLPIPPIWFSPLDDPLKMLMVSMVIGLIHIYTGIIVKMTDQIKRGYVLDGLMDQGLWLLFITGLVLVLGGTQMPALAQPAKIISIIGAAGLVLTQGRANKNIIKRLMSGILSLYDVSGYLSDVLSYSRLLALGLGTTVIGLVINNMVVMAAQSGILGIVLAAVVFIAGHSFNLLINVLGAYVHASRLQYVEFFTKFYDSGGRTFTPFKITTKYIDLELEEREA